MRFRFAPVHVFATGLFAACSTSEVTPLGDVGSDTSVPEDTQTDPVDTSDATAPDSPDTTDDGIDTPDTADPDAPDVPVEPSWEERFERVFPKEDIVPISLDFADGVWEQLLAAWSQDQQKLELPATLTYGDAVLPAVGVRLKGLNSLNVPVGETADPTGKYPLRIDFNSQGGERLHGVDEVRLNSGGQDPSLMRDWLTAEMYRSFGLHAAHISYGDVTIEGVRVGVYALSQAVDKQFLKERYGTEDDADDGNLYKCVYNGLGLCSLAWRGDAREDYVATEGCAPGYDDCGFVLETNEDDPALNDYKDLIEFIRVLNETPESELEAELPKVFDVEAFLRLSAIAMATANSDSYFGKGHNFFLYRRADGRFEMIPWDFDLAYGGGCEPEDFEPTCGGLDSHPLVAKIWSVPAWRTHYRELLCEVATTWLTPARHTAWIAALDTRIGALMATDPNPSPVGSYAVQTAPDGNGDGNLHAFVARRAAYLSGACTPE
ncbi:MAG: CotH kinase family protein [Myxococcales bacterium]|nr:CotH kinase family protein [Myxococcales bacterium]